LLRTNYPEIRVSDVSIGDAVFGPVPYTGPTAGASDFAVLDIWFARPPGLDPAGAAALPMAVETAYRAVDQLGVSADSTVLVHGAGSTVGFAAVQIAALRGARVIATAGETYAEALRTAGAEVTHYGDSMVERVTELAGGLVDLVLDAAPPSDVLPDLVRTTQAPEHVLTVSNFATAEELGARVSFGTDVIARNDVLGEYAQLAAQGRFSVPVARTFSLDEWRTALKLSQSQRARGKLILQISQPSR
jgi:NADPH:quinone reductase-like Zn-dependent oxidoreductase